MSRKIVYYFTIIFISVLFPLVVRIILTFKMYSFIIPPMKINLDKIEKERKRQGLTKTALAHLVGITKSAYSDFVRRKATKLSTLDKIAKALGYDPKDLLT